MLLQVEKEMGNFLDDFLNATPSSRKGLSLVDEDEDNIYVEYDVPGYKKDEIKILQENNMIKLEGKSEKKGDFTGTFAVPKDVSCKDINARLEDGVLRLVLPKSRSPTYEITIK